MHAPLSSPQPLPFPTPFLTLRVTACSQHHRTQKLATSVSTYSYRCDAVSSTTFHPSTSATKKDWFAVHLACRRGHGSFRLLFSPPDAHLRLLQHPSVPLSSPLHVYLPRALLVSRPSRPNSFVPCRPPQHQLLPSSHSSSSRLARHRTTPLPLLPMPRLAPTVSP